MTFVDRVLREHYDELGLASYGLGSAWATVLLTPRFVTSRHVVALVFPSGSRQPSVVVKVPRQPGDNEGVLREATMLTELADRSDGRLTGVPRILGTPQVGSHTVLVQSALHGPPLDPDAVAADVTAAVHRGRDFLERLPVTRSAEDNTGWYEEVVVRPLEALSVLVAAPEVEALVARTHEVLQPLRSTPLPAVFEHADMSHPNLLLGPAGALQVVDWERATVRGLPGHDLVFFLQYVSESATGSYTRDRQLVAFDSAFGPQGWARNVLAAHLRSRGVDAEQLPLILAAAWARSAATLADRLAVLSEDGGSSAPQVLQAVMQDRDFWLWRHAVQNAAT